MISPLRNIRLKRAHQISTRDIRDRVTTLVLGASLLALAFTPIFFLFWVMQPKVLANPGIGALRVAVAASYEPFLHDAEPSHFAEPPRRESAARLVVRMVRADSPLIAPEITVEPEVLVISNGSPVR